MAELRGPVPEVALHEPEIPANAGNIARLCATTGAPLHLVGRLGFSLRHPRAQRAGMDYWERAEVHRHATFRDLLEVRSDRPLVAFTTKGDWSLWDVRFSRADILLFGAESRGLPESILGHPSVRTVRIPMAAGERSLNLASAAAVGLYEALRQVAVRGEPCIGFRSSDGFRIIGSERTTTQSARQHPMPDTLTFLEVPFGDMLAWTFYGNTMQAWIAAGVVFVLAFMVLGLAQRVVVGQLRRVSHATETQIDTAIAAALSRTGVWFLTVVAIWAASLPLTLPETLAAVIGRVVVLATLLQIAFWINRSIIVWRAEYGDRMLEEDAAAVTTMRALTFLARVVLWSIVLLVVLDNLGFQVTAMIAGLGVGGIAIALAVQNILGDLFASLSIVLDKPFVVGDFIIVGELLGTVEHVGLKTTRVRSLSGEQLVFSNSDLLNSRIRNFKRMQERRIVFEFGLVYQTPLEQLREIPGVVREIIEAQEGTRFDRAHFKQYGDFSLDFEVVYHVLSADFNVYMDIQQAINFAMYERFAEIGVSFAYPTQTLFVKKPSEQQQERSSYAGVPQ